MGSLAGAAHLLNHNAGVLRGTHGEQKSPVEQKGKSPLDLDFQRKNTNLESVAYRSFNHCVSDLKLEVSEKLPQG